MSKIKINQPLDICLINKINYQSQSEETIIVFENTKGLRVEDLKQLNSNVIISVTGGLDPRKTKFNSEHYQKRTYYSKNEMIGIINSFQKIERNINPLWNELEKCMFVYKSICEFSNYDECFYNGRDASRNLLGMITGRSVCSGYAIIFKEAMDRLGIKCYYQNRRGHHSWNIVELEGKMHSIELTWDTYNKSNNKCSFRYFCRDDKNRFYSDKHHNISQELEETMFNLEEIQADKLVNTLNKISKEKVHKEKCVNKTGYETCQITGKTVIIINNIPYYRTDKINFENTFIRKDNSGFLLLPTDVSKENIKEYVYLIYLPDSKEIKATRIYSEMNLITNDQELRQKIIDSLLTEYRVSEKIRNFNGYVGYVEKQNNLRFYNLDIEQSLGIYR